MDYSPHWLEASPQTCSVVICLLMTRSSCKYIIRMCETIEEFSMEVCVARRGHGTALCPLSIIYQRWQAISLLDSEFRLRDHLKHSPSCPCLVRTSLSARWTPRLNFCPPTGSAKSVQQGKLWHMNFYIFFFYFPPHFFFTRKSEKIPAESDSVQQL